MLAGVRPASPWAAVSVRGPEPPDPTASVAVGMITNKDWGQARCAVRAA